LLVVAGTATEVGKTWAGCRLLERLRRDGLVVAARKPAQSFEAADLDAGEPTDADRLAEATGARPHDVCPAHRWYPVPMAPPMAADRLGAPPIGIGDLLEELRWPDAADVGLVETVGGVRSPIAHDADGVDLARALAPELVLLVADAGLGTLHAVRSCLDALDPLPVVVLLNRYDAQDHLHDANRRWLSERDGFDVVTDVDDVAARLAP
jgi:dethiobiotin synthetase